MIRIGAYRKGADATVDEAIEFYPALEAFLSQDKKEKSDLSGGYVALAEILGMEKP